MPQFVLWAVAALALLGGLVLWAFQGHPPATPQAPVAEDSTAPPAPGVQSNEDKNPTAVDGREIRVGDPGQGRYFSVEELSAIGLGSIDPTQVRYWADLDLNFLAKGILAPLAVDVIPSVDAPRWVTPAEADPWLEAEALVVGLELNGQARAYPVAILNWHEIVNDRVGQTPVVVTYCPLCNSSLAFIPPEIEGQRPEFGTSGRLYLSDLVMYDRVTGTFWSQLEAAPIVGPLVGRAARLERVSVDMVPYGLWKAQHPDTRVLDRPQVGDRLGNATAQRDAGGGLVRNYDSDPYARYRVTNPALGQRTQFGIPINDDRLQAKDTVIGIAAGGRVKAYALDALRTVEVLNDTLGGQPVLAALGPAGGVRFFARTVGDQVLTFTREGTQLRDDQGGAWSLLGEGLSDENKGQQLDQIVGQVAFWFAWISFNPDTELYTL